MNKSDMWSMATKIEPDIEFVIPKTMADGVKCSDYGPGCLAGFTVKVRNLEMICLQFASEEQAKIEALRIDQFYFKNWIFDDVSDEPKLERFVTEAFAAKRPLKLTPLPTP